MWGGGEHCPGIQTKRHTLGFTQSPRHRSASPERGRAPETRDGRVPDCTIGKKKEGKKTATAKHVLERVGVWGHDGDREISRKGYCSDRVALRETNSVIRNG